MNDKPLIKISKTRESIGIWECREIMAKCNEFGGRHLVSVTSREPRLKIQIWESPIHMKLLPEI